MTWLRYITLFFITAALGSQATWKVHCSGAYGAQFTDLPAAVAAASPGDTILVYTTNTTYCNYYNAPVIAKGLHIVGLNVGNAGPYRAPLRGSLVIVGLPLGQQVTISGIEISHGTFPDRADIIAIGCDGDITIDNAVYYANNFMTSSYVHFERCRSVTIRGSYMSQGMYPMTVIDSTLLLSGTTIGHVGPSSSHYIGELFWGIPTPVTVEGMRLVRSNVTMANSLVIGSDYLDFGNAARPGASLEDSVLRVGPGSNLTSGYSPGWPYFTQGYTTTGQSRVERDPRSGISGLTSVQPPPVPTTLHSVDQAEATAGQPLLVRVAGPTNGFALLAVSDWSSLPTLTPFGDFFLDPFSFQLLDVLACPAPDGAVTQTYLVPVTTPNGHAYAFQALTLAPNGELGLTIPSPFTVGWRYGGIP
jgi:hypothetical protein